MSKQKFQADFSNLFLGQKFASGGQSEIYRGAYDGEQVAVKIIQVPEQQPLDDCYYSAEDEEERKQAEKKQAEWLKKLFKNEAAILSRLNHRNILKFVAADEKYPIYSILTEYLPGGSLRSYLNNLGKKSLTLPKVIEMALDIARGMEYLHRKGIVHRDLKPGNVLIGRDFRLKVADFGVSCEESKCKDTKNKMGSYVYMAPEVFGNKSYDRKVDVYAFGLMLWELVSGETPFADMAPVQAAEAAANKNLRPYIPDDFPPAIGDLMRRCWSAQPKKRPDFWQIVAALEKLQDRAVVGQAMDKSIGVLADHMYKHSVLHWFKSHKPRLGLLSS